tara:strand:+ start:57 stop:533 length:477 start_codon:yes stop_codon:yes gene_type:complete
MRYWLLASYKINEIKRAELNLSNQKFEYYLPKIITKDTYSTLKEELMFPGYIFVNTSFENYSSLQYTSGIKNVIKFGDRISYISDDEIKSIQMVEKSSKTNPIALKIHIGQEVTIAKGSFKGNIVKICSLPSRKRVDVLLSMLGSMRRISIPEKDLIF